MALEALSSNELFNYIIYDTISATPYSSHDSSETGVLLESVMMPRNQGGILENSSLMTQKRHSGRSDVVQRRQLLAVQGRKKRRRKPRVCKNKEEAETQRMTHIAVERNRRKQMNEHLVVLRSLMPESYAQRGDQASIVGGAIEFVKVLEHLLQSLEAQKLQRPQPGESGLNEDMTTTPKFLKQQRPPFAQFFAYPQYTWSQIPNKYASKTKAAIADIEVTLIETHASLRILSRRSPRQLSKLVAGFQTLCLSILHLNVTTMDPLVLYSISAKVEEGCRLTSVDDIAGAVHHMLRIIEDEAALC
ncbi:transcription factor bHLH71-like [Juglans regia]|uniref:Transcription factor bHLH71-like n=2 Tax=Juglans regia TaxID=51240 RepID=A0A2I4DZ79_JUGRE|nr:transcription factor bHLH71-like [Juglans regia]